MPRPRITVTEAFYDAVEAYREEQHLASWAQAAVELMAIGFQFKTGREAPQSAPKWGGTRTSRKRPSNDA